MVARAAATALLLSLLACSPALAADRDRDRMPDSWERRHKVSKPRADKDRDGLRNRDEYRFGWNPRKRDTDRDGIRDGRENAGVVVAVAGRRVTIKLARGGRLRGLLDDPSALACVTVAAPGASAPGEADWAPEDGTDEEPGLDEDFEWDPAWGEQPADLDADEDEEQPPLARTAQFEEDEESFEDEEAAAEAEDLAAEAAPASEECRAALKVGARVHEATSELGTGGRRLTRLRLVT